jgi:hypothetical protein
MTQDIATPGRDWGAIIGRKSAEHFAQAFVAQPVLEALVLPSPRAGIAAMRDYFDASRALFEQIAFVREARGPDRVFLEWEGRFAGEPIEGVTILSMAGDGRIARVRIHHYPQNRADAFARALADKEKHL